MALAGHNCNIRAATIKACEIATDGLTAVAMRACHDRLPVHLDVTDLEPNVHITKAAALFAGLLASPKEDRVHTVLMTIDGGPSARPAHGGVGAAKTRRLGVATLTDLAARGRKCGISPVIATQRLAKLAASVVSELHDVLLGLNIFDQDMVRAADLLGFGTERAAALRCPSTWRVLPIGSSFVPVARAGGDRADREQGMSGPR
jgi:uncharacterized protein